MQVPRQTDAELNLELEHVPAGEIL